MKKIFAILEEHMNENFTVVSYPSGNCPYYLISCDELPFEGAIEVKDTALFFSQYDLYSESDENEQIE